MNVSMRGPLASIVLLLIGIAGGGAACAHGTQAHAAPAASSAASAKDSAGETLPATADGIWATIDHHVADLGKLIQAGTLGEVHHHAFAIRDLVAALPDRSDALPPPSLRQVKANVKFVATLAERLDATGDANDKAGAQSNFDKMNKVLEAMRTNYPPPAK